MNATTTYSSLSYLSPIERTSTAWLTHAPQAKFASKSWAEFQAATESSRRCRSTLATLNSMLRGGIAARTLADLASRAIANRVIAGIQGEAAFGPDSALYRAIGLIPPRERKSPCAVSTPEEAAAPKVRKGASPTLMERVITIRAAWAEIAPDATLFDISLAQFDEAVAPSHAIRETLAAIRTNLRAAVGMRDAADEVSLALVQRVVSGIRADEAYGTESPVYRALGYIPGSERRGARRTDDAPASGATPRALAE